jgi:hypothetical protein
MVFNTTFNNISVISRQSDLLVEKLEYPEKINNGHLKDSFFALLMLMYYIYIV